MNDGSEMGIKRRLFFAALALGWTGAAGAQTFLLPGTVRIKPGDVGYLDIRGDANFHDLVGVQLLLDYSAKQPAAAPTLTPAIQDPRNPKEVVIGPLIPSPFFDVKVKDQALSLAAVVFDPHKSGDGPGLIVSIPFRMPANAPAGASYSALLLNHQAVNLQNQTIPTATTSGRIVADPSAASLGDVNGDGKVNVADAIMTLKIVVKLVQPTAQQIYAADVAPRDGRILATDVTGILRRTVGLPFTS
jgi:hypothetical protein